MVNGFPVEVKYTVRVDRDWKTRLVKIKQATPATNTLPIRRLNLAVGESAEVTAAWFRIPEFTVAPLRQRYTRLAEDTYRYESLDHAISRPR